MKLNIGCGENLLEGYTNVDIRPETKADIICEIGKDKLPIPDNSVDFIVSHHSFEHFTDFLTAVNDLVRVSKSGCTWDVTVPYLTNTKFNYINPYHKIHFTEDSFRFFDDIYERERDKSFKIITKEVTFNYNKKLWGIHEPEVWEEMRQKYWNVVIDMKFNLTILKN